MLDNFIRKGGTKAQRRVRAAATLMFLPLIVCASIVVGTFHYIYDLIRDFVMDMKELFVSDIPRVFKELVNTVKTGEI